MNPNRATILPCIPTAPAKALPDCLAGQPEIFMLAGLAKAGLLPFLQLIHVLPAILPYIFCKHTHFQHHAIFLAAPPHTLFRQDTAKSGKKRPYYTTQSGHGTIITHQTPVSCVMVCPKMIVMASAGWRTKLYQNPFRDEENRT